MALYYEMMAKKVRVSFFHDVMSLEKFWLNGYCSCLKKQKPQNLVTVIQ